MSQAAYRHDTLLPMFTQNLAKADPAVDAVIRGELHRQQETIQARPYKAGIRDQRGEQEERDAPAQDLMAPIGECAEAIAWVKQFTRES